MRVAILSDIHANLPALEAVLEALAPFDQVWQLGDVVGYGPQPNEVVARLREVGATGVRGNHDAAALGQLATDTFNDDARTAVEWNAGRISPSTRAWLAALPERVVNDGYTLVHGSPRDPTWEYLITTAMARANLSAFDTRYCLVGHTHIPLVFHEDPVARRVEMSAPSEGETVRLDERRAILNPGSVGQPRDGDPRACGMVIDTELGIAQWHRVRYDITEVQRLMEQAGLPGRLIDRLSVGW